MSIYGFVEMDRADVPTPAVGEFFEFIDSANSKKTRKDSDGNFLILEGAGAGITAADIANVPSGSISSGNVQGALNELDSEKAPSSHVGSGGVSQHALVTGADAGFMSSADKNKLDGIDNWATANSSDSFLLSRSNHTGTQSASTISDFDSAADLRVNSGISAHESALDPHPQYTTLSEASAAAPVQSVAGKTGAVSLVKADVGLSNVPNIDATLRDNHTGTQTASTISDFASSVDARITLQKGQPSGLATLDVSGKVPSAQLPSYVDDVLEFANLAAFPVTGETGKIYVDLSNSKIYRWSGSSYVEISPSPGTTDAVPEGVTNLYFTNLRASAAAPVQSVAGKTGVVTLVKADVGLSNVDDVSDLNKPISTSTQTALNGKANTAHTHALSDLTQSGATSGQVPTWSGSAWVAQAPSGGGGGITNAQSIINALIYG